MRSDSRSAWSSTTSTTTPTFYKLTAMWSSQAGSLLLWVWLLSIFASIAPAVTPPPPGGRALRDRRAGGHRDLLHGAARVQGEPVRASRRPAAEGAGLNPLLRHPSMMFHPPMLYSGLRRVVDPVRLRGRCAGDASSTPSGSGPPAASPWWPGRSWGSGSCSAPAGLLRAGLGRLLGMGPGGERVPDAVADRHGLPALIMVQERRNMLKAWNVSLIAGTFTLALLGTFLVRLGCSTRSTRSGPRPWAGGSWARSSSCWRAPWR